MNCLCWYTRKGEMKMAIDKTKLTGVEKVYPLNVSPYEQYMGDFQNPSVVSKINAMIQSLHQIGRLTNETVSQWNNVMRWIVEGGMDEIAETVTNEKVSVALDEVMRMLDVSLDNGLKDLAENVTDKKIDEMLESGQFESMVQTSLVELNEVVENKLNVVDLQLSEKASEAELIVERNRINAFTSLKEGSTTGDAELIDARLSTDGKVYDNLGSAVRSQFQNVNTVLALSDIIKKYKITLPEGNGDIKAELVGFVDTDGILQSSTSFRTTNFIEVSNAVLDIDLIGYPTMLCVSFYDEEKVFISGLSTPTSFTTIKGIQEIPTETKFVRFSMTTASQTKYAKLTNYPLEKRLSSIEEQLNSETGIIETTVYDYSKISEMAMNTGYIGLSGKYVSTVNWFVSEYLTVSLSSVINYNLRGTSSMLLVAFYDINKKFISGIQATGTSPTYHDGVNIKPPSGTVYMRFSSQKDEVNQTVKIETNKINYAYDFTKQMVKDNPLYRKKMISTGDSITASVGHRPYSGYAKMIALKNDMVYTNSAIWGATLPVVEKSSGSILQTIDTMSNDADYIVLSGGANDWYYTTDEAGTEPKGVITEGFSSVLDENTFYGAMESLCKKAINKWVGKKIIYVITHKLTDFSIDRRKQVDELVDGMIKILRKWGIPYVDLYNSMPSLMLPVLKDKYTTFGNTVYEGVGDGLHPNEEGYAIYYNPPIEHLLKSI